MGSWGACGRKFESSHPDNSWVNKKRLTCKSKSFFILYLFICSNRWGAHLKWMMVLGDSCTDVPFFRFRAGRLDWKRGLNEPKPCRQILWPSLTSWTISFCISSIVRLTSFLFNPVFWARILISWLLFILVSFVIKYISFYMKIH